MNLDSVLFHWNVGPDIFSLGPLTVRWYGLLFAIAFLVGLQIMHWIYKREQRDEEELDSLFIFILAGTIIGARLGHAVRRMRRRPRPVTHGVVLVDVVGGRPRAERRARRGHDEAWPRGAALARSLEQVERAMQVNPHHQVEILLALARHDRAKVEDRDRTLGAVEERAAEKRVRYVAQTNRAGAAVLEFREHQLRRSSHVGQHDLGDIRLGFISRGLVHEEGALLQDGPRYQLPDEAGASGDDHSHLLRLPGWRHGGRRKSAQLAKFEISTRSPQTTCATRNSTTPLDPAPGARN